MSLGSSLESSPSNDGWAFSIEALPGSAKRRITRRWKVPAMLAGSDKLPAELFEAWGTADGGFSGNPDTVSHPEARLVYAGAKLVEQRVVPWPDRGNPDGDAASRLVEKVYEETPYEKDRAEQLDAQGALISKSFTAVLAADQNLDALTPAPPGYVRVTRQTGIDAGRKVYAVTDVKGEGVTGTTLREDGEGVMMEEGSYNTMTEPVTPESGAYENWTSTPAGGYWRVNYSKVATAQLPAPGRQRRNKSSRADGSITESVTEAGTAPECNHSLGEGAVIQIGESSFMRQGDIVGRTKQWLKIPVDRVQSAVVGWDRPGRVELAGTIGSGGDASLRVVPGVSQRLPGTLSFRYGPSLTVDAPWNARAWATWTVAGTVKAKDASGADSPTVTQSVLQTGQAPGCLTAMSLVSSATSGKWNGATIVRLRVDSYSDPAVPPTGEVVVSSHLSPYACDLAGVITYECATERVTLS